MRSAICNTYRRNTVLEKFKATFSNLGVLAAAYLPKGFKEAMFAQAKEVDDQRAELDALKKIMNELQAFMNTNTTKEQ